MVRDLFKRKFNKSFIENRFRDGVLKGAAMLAAIYSGEASKELKELLINEATPYSLGIERESGIMTVLIPKNTSFPAKKSYIFTTNSEN